MKVGTKVTTKYGAEAGTIVKVEAARVWVQWPWEREPVPYKRALLRAII